MNPAASKAMNSLSPSGQLELMQRTIALYDHRMRGLDFEARKLIALETWDECLSIARRQMEAKKHPVIRLLNHLFREAS